MKGYVGGLVCFDGLDSLHIGSLGGTRWCGCQLHRLSGCRDPEKGNDARDRRWRL